MTDRHSAKVSETWPGAIRACGKFACTALLIAGICVASGRFTRTQSPTEYQIKAAYLLNFLKFVEWPGDQSKTFNNRWVIGVVGDNPFGEELSQLVLGRVLQGRLLEVKTFLPGDDFRACHILFVSASEKKRLPSIFAALKGTNTLTVGDMDHFNESGGMIQFVVEDGRVRFAINLGAASAAQLKVSSKLLSLAQSVTGAEGTARN